LGTVLWISFYAAVIVGTCQKQKLEEDLANKPTESSNQSMRTLPQKAWPHTREIMPAKPKTIDDWPG
jgi:hypothetical protein